MHSHIPDVLNLAISLKEQLVPYLPLLTEGVSQGIGKGAGEIAVKKIWEKLEPALKGNAKIAAEQVAAKPESEARQAVFQEELETLLKENPDLAQAIAQIMAEITIETQISQFSRGNGATVGQVLGGNVNISITNHT
jgi:hypothetical protein